MKVMHLTRPELLKKLSDTYAAKNHDYGNSAHQTFAEFGEVAYIVRLCDKFQRLETLQSDVNRRVSDESVLDTIGDAITYLAMLVAELDCLCAGDQDDIEHRCALQTVALLRSLATAHSFPHAGNTQSFRSRLIAIYKTVNVFRARANEYYELADELVEAYLAAANDDRALDVTQ